MKFGPLIKHDFEDWLSMGLLLWPRHSKNELKEEFLELFSSPRCKTFLCKDESGNCVGFVNVSLRIEPVPGAKTTPVGYIEGIFVKKEFRKKGIARKLFSLAEQWAASKGCKEIGSDTNIWNRKSKTFHSAMGFTSSAVLSHFIKKIKN